MRIKIEIFVTFCVLVFGALVMLFIASARIESKMFDIEKKINFAITNQAEIIEMNADSMAADVAFHETVKNAWYIKGDVK